MATIFGQIVVGPPGSGKSTYCKFISESLRQVGRQVRVINLDAANEKTIYTPFADITNLIRVKEIMKELNLGPNGSMLESMTYLERNIAWLYDVIVDAIEDVQSKTNNREIDALIDDNKAQSDKPYLLFDCPGQSELYTINQSMQRIVKKITREKHAFDLRLTCVNLCDSYYSNDLGKYIGVLLNSLSTMLNLELPHVNILSKIDLLEMNGRTNFRLNYYTEVLDLEYLLESFVDDPFFKKYKDLSRGFIDIIQDYSLVTFMPLNIRKPEDICAVMEMIDKSNGYFVNDLDLALFQQVPMISEIASGRRSESGELRGSIISRPRNRRLREVRP